MQQEDSTSHTSCFPFLGTHEVLFDHVASFPSSWETISRPGIEPPTTPFGLGPLSSGSSGSSQTFEKKTKFFETTLVPFTTLLSNYTMVSFQRKMLRLKKLYKFTIACQKVHSRRREVSPWTWTPGLERKLYSCDTWFHGHIAHELCNVMSMSFLKLLLKLCQVKDEVATMWLTLVATLESSRLLCLKFVFSIPNPSSK